METKKIALPFEIKDLTEEGVFKGRASVYDEIDLGGDVVRAGAFKKTLSENKDIPILWQHDPREVIGKGTLRDTPEGLMVEGELDLEDPIGRKAYNKLKRGLLKGLSIGFSTVKDEIKEGIRELLEVKLWEVSVVTFPMLPSAQVVSVKDSLADKAAGTLQEPPETAPQAENKSRTEPDLDHSLLAFLQSINKGV